MICLPAADSPEQFETGKLPPKQAESESWLLPVRHRSGKGRIILKKDGARKREKKVGEEKEKTGNHAGQPGAADESGSRIG